MKIQEMINSLEAIKEVYGEDIECLIEAELEYCTTTVSIDELSIEDRDGFGLSVKFLM